METDTATAPYLLLFRNSGPETHAHLTGDEREDLMKRWNSWYDSLAVKGKAIGGSPLEEKTRVLSGPQGSRVTDGPFAEAKEAIGGYVILLADSFEEATKMAQEHPGLTHGLVIEVRPMAQHCHLGITPKMPTLSASR
jgi:hypothetical protein